MYYSILLCGYGSAGKYVSLVAEDSGRAYIKAVFDPNKEKKAEAKATYPDAILGNDLRSLIRDTRPDIVAVASPDHLHADQTIMALELGSHVLVEKPMTTTVSDAERVIKVAEETGLTVMVDHTIRYMYPWREMSEAARAGEIGKIFFIQGDYIHDMSSIYQPDGNRHTPWRIDSENPQNILFGGGCHPIDNILSTINSQVVELFAYSSKECVPAFPADDCYILMLKFKNGVLGKVFVTSGCSGEGIGGGLLAIYGDQGTLLHGKLHRRGKKPKTLRKLSRNTEVGGHGWGCSVVDFLDTLDGKRGNPISARIGARVVAICEAGLTSIRTGQPQVPVWPNP